MYRRHPGPAARAREWADRPLSSIRPSDVDDWIAELSRKTGPHSVRHCYTLFRGPLRRAVKDRLIDDPCIDVPLPKKPDLRETFDDVLSAREVDQLVDAIHDRTPGYAGLKTDDRYEALGFMGAWLGPRWNEVIGVRRCDLNPLRREITFGKGVVNQNGSQTCVERLSKTEDFRTIPVPAPVMDRLFEHIAEYCRTPDTLDGARAAAPRQAQLGDGERDPAHARRPASPAGSLAG